jgi:hypothetical protein
MIFMCSSSSFRLASATVALVDEPTERVETLEDVDASEDWDDAILSVWSG